jgi:hypothetical protein
VARRLRLFYAWRPAPDDDDLGFVLGRIEAIEAQDPPPGHSRRMSAPTGRQRIRALAVARPPRCIQERRGRLIEGSLGHEGNSGRKAIGSRPKDREVLALSCTYYVVDAAMVLPPPARMPYCCRSSCMS